MKRFSSHFLSFRIAFNHNVTGNVKVEKIRSISFYITTNHNFVGNVKVAEIHSFLEKIDNVVYVMVGC